MEIKELIMDRGLELPDWDEFETREEKIKAIVLGVLVAVGTFVLVVRIVRWIQGL